MSKSQIRNSTAWSRVLLLASGVLFAFVLAEGLLAVMLPAPIVWRAPQERYENHPTRLFSLRPDQQAFTHDKPVRINAHGFRGPEIVMPKPGDRFRIVVMGDSVTFGNGVADDETYSTQLARMLRESGLRNVEVINAGMPAYDTWQEALLLEEVVLSLEPDLVILGFYENDVTPRPQMIRPIINKAGEPPRRGLAGWLGDRWIAVLKKSRVLLLAREAYQRGRAHWFPSPDATRRMVLLNGDHHQKLEAGWREVEQSLDRMNVVLKETRIPFRMVIFPLPEQVWNSGAGTVAYQGRLQEIAAKIGIPTLDLLPTFRKAAAEDRSLYIPWDWHPSAEGHRVAAGAIESFLGPVTIDRMMTQSISH